MPTPMSDDEPWIEPDLTTNAMSFDTIGHAPNQEINLLQHLLLDDFHNCQSYVQKPMKEHDTLVLDIVHESAVSIEATTGVVMPSSSRRRRGARRNCRIPLAVETGAGAEANVAVASDATTYESKGAVSTTRGSRR